LIFKQFTIHAIKIYILRYKKMGSKLIKFIFNEMNGHNFFFMKLRIPNLKASNLEWTLGGCHGKSEEIQYPFLNSGLTLFQLRQG
jgi:hypothetical protein